MGRIRRLLGGTTAVLRRLRQPQPRLPTTSTAATGATPPAPAPAGRTGREATVEVSAGALTGLRFHFAPRPDGRPDPGEVVWTWVPYEEHDGRGKDRPVLLVARDGDTLIGVPLTSKPHDTRPDHADFVSVGTGGWDTERRPSWAAVDRLLRVHPAGMRREGTALDRPAFDRVTARLAQRYDHRR